MSSVSPQVIEYLTKQLSRNPVNESADIVQLRAKAFKLNKKTSKSTNAAPSTTQRQQLRDQLEDIRTQCFSVPVEQLLGQLQKMPLNDFPDLAVLGKRLQTILESRNKLPALSSDPRFDGDLFSCLKKVLISPSRDVSVLREQVISSFRHRANRRRGQAMVRLLKDQLPGLYALEANWLDSLLRFRSSIYGGSITSTLQENLGKKAIAGFFAVVIPVVVILGFFLLRDDKAKRNRITPIYQQPRVTTSPNTPNLRHQNLPTNGKPAGNTDSWNSESEPLSTESPEDRANRYEQFERMRREQRERIEQSRRRAEELRNRRSPSVTPKPNLPSNFPRPRHVPMPGQGRLPPSPGGSPRPAFQVP